MRPFRDLPIKSKLTLMLALTAAVSVALSGTALMLNEARLIKTSTVQTLTALAKVLGANSAAALTFDDRAAANETLFFLLEEHLVKPVLEAIKTAGEFDKPGTGIAFVLPVEEVMGLESQMEKFRVEVRDKQLKI